MSVALAILEWLFTSKLGRSVLVVLLVSGAYGAGDWHGRSVANKDAEIASLQSKVAAAKADADISTIMQKSAQAKLDALTELHSGLALKASSYEEEVSKLSAEVRACRIATDSDIKRLRNIR